MVGGLRYDGPENMPPGMRRLMEAQKAGQKAQEIATSPAAPRNDSESGQKQNKYHNTEAVVDGIRFQSRKEARRFAYLQRAQELGVIEDLRLQVHFTLQEAYTTPTGERIRAIRYVADFTYRAKSAGYDHALQLDMADIEYWRSLYPGALVIEDTKSRGTRTKEYKIKRKLMADKGHEIREV